MTVTPQAVPASRTTLFANRWWIVVASVIALIPNLAAINIFAFSVFFKPVSSELGFTRGELSFAVFLNSMVTAVASPFFGWLLDRYGARRVMLVSIPLFSLNIAAYSLLSSSFAVLYFLYLLAGITCMGQSTVGYLRVAIAWFDRRRGLAVGITTAGVGLGTALMPKFSEFLIESFGWRVGYIGLGISIIILAFVPVLLFVREPRMGEVNSKGERHHSERAAAEGVSLGAAVRDRCFWMLLIAFSLAVMAINGTLAHTVPLLTDRGMSPQTAASALSIAGIALMFGRVVSGYLIDRLWGPYIASGIFALPIVGMVLLDGGYGGYVPLVAVILCGIAVGAELDFMGFFLSRYFGLKAFGQIYGWIFAAFTVGTGLGPYLMGLTFDRFHSYSFMFYGFEGALIIVCILIAMLPTYRFAAKHDD